MPEKIAWGKRYPKPQAQCLARDGVGRDETGRVLPWYRRAKATKQRGTNGRKSERLDSTVEVGEDRPSRPDGGKRDVGWWNRL